MVEMLIDGIWVDLSTLGLVLDRDKVNLSYGQSSEGSVADPARCSFSLKNGNAAFSLSNPESEYWGKVDRGTRIRISVPLGNGKGYRFQGQLVTLPQESDISGQSVWMSFEAAGYLRNLGQGNRPLHSPLYREIMGADPVGIRKAPKAYWAMEDDTGASAFTQGVGLRPMTYTGQPSLAAYSDFACSEAIPNINGSTFTGTVSPSYSIAAGSNQEVDFLLAAPGGLTNGMIIAKFYTSNINMATIHITYPSTDHLQLLVYDSDGNLVADSGSTAVSVAGDPSQVKVRLFDDGTNCTFTLFTQRPSDVVPVSSCFASISSINAGSIKTVVINPSQTAVDAYVGHVAVYYVSAVPTVGPQFGSGNALTFQSIDGYNGELADTRFERLCTEEGITHEVLSSTGYLTRDLVTHGFTGEGVPMGPQTTDNLLTLLRACEAADRGIIYEMTSDQGIGYRTRGSLENQDPALTLSHATHELTVAMKPTKDESYLKNDFTVTRNNGISARVFVEAGKMSILPPPAGIGPYEDSAQLNLENDNQAYDLAGWIVNIGSVDEPRYTNLAINLAHVSFQNSHRNDVLNVRPGDRVVITDLPTDPRRLGFDDISQLGVGFTEVIDNFQHVITMNSSPESPYRVNIVDEGRAQAANSWVVSGLNTTATTFEVATGSADGGWMDDATYPNDFPFDIMVEGERMTVSGITALPSPQTFTVTRSINGVVKHHNDQAKVDLFDTPVAGL